MKSKASINLLITLFICSAPVFADYVDQSMIRPTTRIVAGSSRRQIELDLGPSCKISIELF